MIRNNKPSECGGRWDLIDAFQKFVCACDACGFCHPVYLKFRVFWQMREHNVIFLQFGVVRSLSPLRRSFCLLRKGLLPCRPKEVLLSHESSLVSLVAEGIALIGAASSSTIPSEKCSSKFNNVSCTKFAGTLLPLSGSRPLGMVSNDGEALCLVTATRNTKLSVQHVMVFLPYVNSTFSYGCREYEQPNSSHNLTRDDTEG